MRGEGSRVGSLPGSLRPGDSAASVCIWGDGAVGIGLAVALSRTRPVLLVGPPGVDDSTVVIESSGSITGSARVRRVPADRAPASPVCLMAVKAFDLAAASRQSRLAGNATHVCLCNGMGLEEQWGPGWDEVESAVVLGGFERTGGLSVATHPGGLMVLDGGIAAGLFEGSGVVPTPCDRRGLAVTRWAKWLVNSSLNPVAALSSRRNDELDAAGLAPLVWSVVSEILPVVPGEFRDEAMEKASGMLRFLLAESRNRCSMLQDMDAGRRTEIDFMTGLAAGRLRDRCPIAFALSSLVRAGRPGASSGPSPDLESHDPSGD